LVRELWRFRNPTISIDQIVADGTYVTTESSRFLYVRAHEVTRWVVGDDASDRLAWKKRLAEWVQTELKPRVAPAGQL
jgi:hypothetical protein